MQSLFPFNIEAPLGLQNVLQNAFSHRFIFFSTTIGLMKGSRMSRRISRKAWLQRNLCTSGGVETSLRAPPVLFYTEEDTILRFVEFHLHGLCYVAEYIRRTDTCIADNTMDFSRGMFQESVSVIKKFTKNKKKRKDDGKNWINNKDTCFVTWNLEIDKKSIDRSLIC